MSVLVPQDVDFWKEKALKWEKEAQKWTDEAARLKGEVDDWRGKFESLLEASLGQISRVGAGNEENATPHMSPSTSVSEDMHVVDKKTPKKTKGFFAPLFIGKEEKALKKEKKEKKDRSAPEKKDVEVAEESEFSQPLSPSIPYQHLPRLQVNPVMNIHRTILITGPEADKNDGSYLDAVAGKSISTYPFIPGNPTRDGDPICDHFTAQIYENRLIAVVADGCGWGEKPRAAARSASNAFVDYVNLHHDHIVDVKKAGVVLLNAFESAHNSIMEGKSAFWEAGTTTLLGGVLLEINKGNDTFTPQWEFVCASIGDCKAFCYTNGEITDITQGNRQNAIDPQDCGGRLGPHLEEGKPDLRNLNLFCFSCEEGDIIFMLSDGVHDNLDPQHLGKLPKDMPKEYNLTGDRWDDADTAKAIYAKNQYATQLLVNIIDEATIPKQIAEKIVDHCVNVTQKSREYMESNNGKRLPANYVEFPGKMDHTTCLCFRVGRFALPQGSSPNASPGSSPSQNNSSGSNNATQKDNWTKIVPSTMH